MKRAISLILVLVIICGMMPGTVFAANDVELEGGENTVCSVTHNLSNAAASKHDYKGISAGSSFTEKLSGQNMTVTVTMGDEADPIPDFTNTDDMVKAIRQAMVCRQRQIQMRWTAERCLRRR